MKLSLKKIYFNLLLCFPIATLFQTDLLFVNKFLFSVLLFIQFILFFNKISIKCFLEFFVVMIIFIFNYFITNGTLYNLNEIFYLPFCIMFLSYFYDN